jgi:hypothetical protein
MSAEAISAIHEDALDARVSCVPIPDDTSSQVTAFRERAAGCVPLVVKRFIRKIMFTIIDILRKATQRWSSGPRRYRAAAPDEW